MTTIYIASKVKHAARWLKMREDGYPIISSWIDEAGAGESQDLNDLWHRCIDEASSCDVLIIYCEPGDVLKGAWIELGAALASSMRPFIFAVGIGDFTISNHSDIRHFSGIEAAFSAALTVAQ